MKKILGISSVFVVIGLIVSLIVGFSMKIPATVASEFAGGYKFSQGMEFFIRYLPAMIITGFAISCAVQFGQNPEGSADRFSKAMALRFKKVIISGIIICAVLTLCSELFGLLLRQNKERIINKPKLINEYIRVGSELYDNGYYDRAMLYAKAALELSPKSRGASQLLDSADIAINRRDNANYRFRINENAREEVETVNHARIDGEKIGAAYQNYIKAKLYFEDKDWFNAHYYAQLGLQIALETDETDPNIPELKQLSTQAWNNLSNYHNLDKTEDQMNVDRKYEGYKALVEKDDLKAYYIFKELFETSADLQRDPDVKFYLEIAENRVKENFFFIDETLELSSFEDANDVYYAYTYKNGAVDIIYFKGVSVVKGTGHSIQYLRNLTINSLSSTGELLKTMTVPYAKVLPVDVKSLDSTTKMTMGLDDKADFVPYVMLNSVGRDEPEIKVEPVFTYYTEHDEEDSDYLLLPIPYNDFVMLEDLGQNPETMPITSLFKMVTKAEKYGFCPQYYGSTLLNRLLYPLLILIIVVFIGSFGWNNRIGMNQYFKMSWALAFPFIFVIALLFYKVCMMVFKLINFAVLGSVSGLFPALFTCIGIYVLMFIIFSIYFCARSTKI